MARTRRADFWADLAFVVGGGLLFGAISYARLRGWDRPHAEALTWAVVVGSLLAVFIGLVMFCGRVVARLPFLTRLWRTIRKVPGLGPTEDDYRSP